MALPTTGPLHAWQINQELDRPTEQTISLNDSQVRSLAGRPSGIISYSDLRGKSWIIDTLGIYAGHLAVQNVDKGWAPGIRGASENVGLRLSGGGSFEPLGSFSKNTFAGRRIQGIYTTEPSNYTIGGDPGIPTLFLIFHGHITVNFFTSLEIHTIGVGHRGTWALSAATVEQGEYAVSIDDTIPVTRVMWTVPTWDVIRANANHDIILR